MLHAHRFITLALAGVALAMLAGCSAEHDPATGADIAPITAATVEAMSENPAGDEPAAIASQQGGFASSDWLPPATDGALPRTLAGYTLLDAQPEGSVPGQGGVFKSAQTLAVTGNNGDVRVLSFDGRIFRIEHTLPAQVDFAQAASAARDAYGAPADEDASLIQFGKKLGVGDTILGVRALGEHVQVFIEDPGTVLKAF